MNRVPPYRRLKPLRSLKHTDDFYVYDIETGVRKGKEIHYGLMARPENYIFGVVYGKDYVKVLHSPQDAIAEFQKRRYRNKYVFAHNAEYDLTGTYGNIYMLDNNAIFNGKFISATNGVCTFADSYNILPTSASEIGKMIGMHKKTLGNNLISTDINKDIDYCITDCKIIYEALKPIFETLEPSLTIGSLSLKMFRAFYMDKTIKIHKLSDEFFRAYYGGRTEAFYIGECTADVYDINSAYPNAMLHETFPDPESLQKTFVHSMSELSCYLDTFEGMFTGTITYKKDLDIPILPVRMNSKLMFPTGTFSGSWCFNELRYALPYIAIKFPVEIIFSSPIASPFASFINDRYTIRNNSENVFVKYYEKLFMNNLYGKLVQRIDEKYVFIENKYDVYNMMKQYRSKHAELIENDTGGYFLRMKLPEEMTNHTLACLGAYITASVRVTVHTGIMVDPKRTLYCDTDSLFVRRSIFAKARQSSTELGGWKKENKVVTKIVSPKNYEFEYTDASGDVKRELKLKGVKRGAVNVTNEHGDILPNVYEFKRMIKTKEHFKRKDKTPAGTFITQQKVISGDYDKRIVLKNGNTKPIKLCYKE